MASPSPDRPETSRGTVSPQTGTGYTIADPLSVEENGRLFNGYREGKYLLPNDGDEQDRLDLQHKIWIIMLDGELCLSPINETGNALEIGSGTGIWAIEFARKYPHSTIVGTDISLIQPSDNVPPNCTFVREDAEDMWIFDKPFDFIHWRLMFSCFTDNKAMMNRVYDNLASGGWAEFHELAGECVGEDAEAEELYQRSAFRQWHRYLMDGGLAIGRDFRAPHKYKQWMLEAGFVDVVEKQILIPINGWPLNPKDHLLGKWSSLDLLRLVETVSKLLRAGGLPQERAPAFYEAVREDITNRALRVYGAGLIIYGRKPEN